MPDNVHGLYWGLGHGRGCGAVTRIKRYNGCITREQWLLRETRLVARMRLDEGLSDREILERVVSQNLFQYPTERELRSITRACCRRLTGLSDDAALRAQLSALIAHGTPDQARQVNLYALMRSYRLIWEFMCVVVAAKRRTLDDGLTSREVAAFLEGLRAQDETVAGWSDATLNKIRQVFLNCLVECGMYDRANATLKPILLDFELEQAIRANQDAEALAAFGCME